jgi:pilus assembly protein Flp/PilA
MILTTEGRQIMLKFMSTVRQTVSGFAHDQRGATSIEYALIASGVSIVIIATVTGLGTNVKTMFTSVSSALK